MLDERKILQRAMLHFGFDSQINQIIEECAELTVALNHMRRGRVPAESVIEELVDVAILVSQMAEYFGFEKVDTRYDEKLEALSKMLDALGAK